VSNARPIIFSGEMVLRLLDGTKTKTRRKVDPDKDLAQGCPYGATGDKLWVREIFSREAIDPSRIVYRADPGTASLPDPIWTSPIFMPKKASRISLEIVEVTRQRIQDISPAEAISEGILVFGQSGRVSYRGSLHLPERSDPIAAFRDLWDSIAKPRFQWDLNPYVWALSFEQIAGKL
jgi:hypothetical protein